MAFVIKERSGIVQENDAAVRHEYWISIFVKVRLYIYTTDGVWAILNASHKLGKQELEKSASDHAFAALEPRLKHVEPIFKSSWVGRPSKPWC